MGLIKSATAVFAATLSIACLPSLSQAALVLPAAADAEIREDGPELTRGAGAAATTGGQTELAVRSGSGQNRWSIVRFDLTGLSAANVGTLTDLKLNVRGAGGWLNNQAGGVRIFGLNSTAPQQLWNEQTVFYRDAGDAIPVSPAGGHPGSQPPVAGLTPGINPPPQPITVAGFGSSAPSWNSNPNHVDRAPGLVHENPPYSQEAETENAARYQRNLDRHGGILGGAYESYINQPAYTQAVTNATYPVLASMPLSTFNDADSSPTSPFGTLTTFLGFLNFDAQPAASRPQGYEFSFTMSPDASMSSHNSNNNLALIAYLTTLLNNGGTSATFLISSKLTGDPTPVTGSNMQFASKDFWPVTVGTGNGPFGPELILNDVPEPTAALALVSLAGVAAIRRRVRSVTRV
jgi:MYXO-CTERM domain-containing protein